MVNEVDKVKEVNDFNEVNEFDTVDKVDKTSIYGITGVGKADQTKEVNCQCSPSRCCKSNMVKQISVFIEFNEVDEGNEVDGIN